MSAADGLGTHTVTVTSPSGTASITFELVPATGQLPTTGTDATPLAVAAAGLLLSGAASHARDGPPTHLMQRRARH